jgi:hypothetical protein
MMNFLVRVGIVASLVVLGACGAPTPPIVPKGHLGLNPTITGTVPNYSFGAKPLDIKAFLFVLEAGAIAANGNFTVTLPATGVPDFDILPACTSGTITAIPNSVKAAQVSTSVTQSDEAPFPAALGQTWNEYSRIFVSQDVVLNGSCRYLANVNGTTNSDTYNNLVLKQGWNEITTQITRNNANNLFEEDKLITLGIPENQPWRITSSGLF